MNRTAGLLVACLIVAGGALAQTDIERRYSELLEDAREPVGYASEAILDDFFGYLFAETQNTLVTSGRIAGEYMVSIHEVYYPDLTDEGAAILDDAVKAELFEELMDLDFRTRLMEAQCDAELDDAVEIAHALADVAKALYERRLKRYTTVYDSLPPEDQARVGRHNAEHYQLAYPSVPRDRRNIHLTLATESPDAFKDHYASTCEYVLAHRGQAYRKVVSEPEEGCDRTTSDGTNTHVVSSCWTTVEYTQKPEAEPSEPRDGSVTD